MLLEDNNAPTSTPSEDGAPKEKKKNQGFFGIGAEAIQLDGNDAATPNPTPTISLRYLHNVNDE